MAKVKCGLIQMAFKGDTNDHPDKIRDVMLEVHIPYIEDAGKQGVQVLCFQEVFTQPYFLPEPGQKVVCRSRGDSGWAHHAAHAGVRKETQHGHCCAYLRRSPCPVFTTIPVPSLMRTVLILASTEETHIPQVDPGFYEKFFFKPGDLGYPVFETAYLNLGVYICYDRHFPEGWRALALNGAEYIVNPSATVAGLSKYLWELEQPASAAANGVFIGAINRVGTEAPWDSDMGEFYGSSYIVNPRGAIEAQASYGDDELLVHEIDLDMVREVRNTWQFFRDRRPELYLDLIEG